MGRTNNLADKTDHGEDEQSEDIQERACAIDEISQQGRVQSSAKKASAKTASAKKSTEDQS